MLNAKLLLVVACAKALGKKETSQFAKLVEAMHAAWPNQEAVKGPEYAECSQAAQQAYCEAGGTKGGARYAWSVALSKCGLLPVKKDGTVMQKKGKTGAKAGAKADAKAPVTPSTISDAEAVQHFFGHSDANLITAVKIAAANEQAFLRFAEAIAKQAAQTKADLKKAA